MRHILVKAEFEGLKSKKVTEALVDTGASYTALPTETSNEIGVSLSPYRIALMLADGKKIEAAVGECLLTIMGRKQPVKTVVYEKAPVVIGMEALEILGLNINVQDERLEPYREPGALMLRLLTSRSTRST